MEITSGLHKKAIKRPPPSQAGERSSRRKTPGRLSDLEAMADSAGARNGNGGGGKFHALVVEFGAERADAYAGFASYHIGCSPLHGSTAEPIFLPRGRWKGGKMRSNEAYSEAVGSRWGRDSRAQNVRVWSLLWLC
jgi:hypothetical protein